MTALKSKFKERIQRAARQSYAFVQDIAGYSRNSPSEIRTHTHFLAAPGMRSEELLAGQSKISEICQIRLREGCW
jgi:hypothetical protein